MASGRWRRGLLATVILASILVGACSPAASPSPSPTPTPSASVPPVTPSPTPVTPAPSASPIPTAVALSEDEQVLADAIRIDARVGCAPVRTGLPPGSNAGVECHPSDALVGRVQALGFDLAQDDPVLQWYIDRLAAQGVQLRSGDCAAGQQGDKSWPAYLRDEGDAGGDYRSYRSGCFLDDNVLANVALTCYGPIYVEIAGTSDDLAALYQWAWRLAEGEDPQRDPPGICAAPD